ncbi:hypothetical protein F4818DRAFT_428092 [Hypoxylon cercidicola]|nr:hypothetical protein F4818DRAFT_428092 [Hypoxylon cercidicola]
MASEQPGPAVTPAGTDSATFTLHIISPSVGIPQPLALQDLPVDTTVKQLRERIRNAVSTRPTDQAQRLIHRGRLLGRDTETMTEVFGQEALRSAHPQTLHLVLRDLSDGRPTTTPTPLYGASQTPASSQQSTGTQAPPQQHIHQQHQPHNLANPFQLPPQVRIGGPHYHGVAFGVPQGHMPGMAATPPTNQPIPVPPSLTPLQYSQWMRAMNVHMNQRPAAPGGQEIPTANMRGTPGTHTPGRTASPLQSDATRTTIRESTGPNGLQWRITVNESFMNPLQRTATGTPFSTADASNHWGAQPRSVPNGGQLSNNTVQNILRGADASSATRAMADAMRRNASSSSLASLSASQAQPPIPPGVTTPLIPSRAGSAAGTPDPLRALGRTRSPPTNQAQVQSSQGAPEVYILSSPNGPRALLLNSNLDTYFSPPVWTANQPFGMPFAQRPFAPTFGNAFNSHHLTLAPGFHPQLSPIGRPSTHTNNVPQPQPQQQPQQHGLPQPPQGQPQIGHAIARPDNPQIHAIRLAQLWPHVWMLIRLGLFIWWFTSPSSSWSRWFTVICIAIVLFFVNAGFLNPIAEQIWIPFRRHLENLIPHADGHQRAPIGAGNAQGANGEAAEPGQQRELDPADTAARLVQQRRNANANWLMNQARRLERAGILFLASIAPGVAERHIALMEAEVRAERRRREAEAAAAAAAAAPPDSDRQEGADQSHENAENGGESTTAPVGESGEQRITEGGMGNETQPAEQEPLIVV